MPVASTTTPKAARGEFAQGGVLVCTGGDCQGGAQFAGQFQPWRLFFDDSDCTGAHSAQRLHQEQPHGAGAEDQDWVGGQDTNSFHGVDHAGQRFDECGLGVGQAFRQSVTGACGGCRVLGEPTGAGDPDPLPVEAVVGHLIAAEIAVAAVEIGVDGDAVADLQIGDCLPGFDDHAAELVAGDDWEF